MIGDLDWRQRAACSPATAHLFESNGHATRQAGHHWRRDAAIRICNRCPVKNECHDDAVASPAQDMWRIAAGVLWPPARPR